MLTNLDYAKNELLSLANKENKEQEELSLMESLKDFISRFDNIEPQIKTLTEEDLNKIIEHISTKGFSVDGCLCGSYSYTFNEDFHLYVYRSCRKSSGCPVGQAWEISEFGFYPIIETDSEDYVSTEFYHMLNIKLNNEQEKIILKHLDRQSEKENGYPKYNDEDRNEEYQGTYQILKSYNNQDVPIAENLTCSEAEQLLDTLNRRNHNGEFFIKEMTE
jgi:hypothetical protein